MENIEIFSQEEAVFSLKFAKAIRDEKAPVRADIFLFLYQFYRNDELIFPYFFIDKFTFFPDQKTVLLQEYPTESAENEGELSPLLFLRLADLDRRKTAKISRLTAGRFVGKVLNENRLIFEKKFPDRTEEFEISMNEVVWENF